LPAGHALHRDGEGITRLRRARHRVAADDLLAADRRAERAVLPSGVGKAPVECRGDVEDERPRIGGLVDHAAHRQGVVAVFSQHRTSRRARGAVDDRPSSGFCNATLAYGKYNSRSMDTRDTPEQAELRRTAHRLAHELGPRTVADLADRERSERL